MNDFDNSLIPVAPPVVVCGVYPIKVKGCHTSAFTLVHCRAVPSSAVTKLNLSPTCSMPLVPPSHTLVLGQTQSLS